MTEAVVVFDPGAAEAAADTICAVLESHMVDFTAAAQRQFVKRVCNLVRERGNRGDMTPPLHEQQATEYVR